MSKFLRSPDQNSETCYRMAPETLATATLGAFAVLFLNSFGTDRFLMPVNLCYTA